MDGVFDHEDPNNRPEEIPMDDLNLPEDDEDDEYFDAHGETSFISGGIPIEMVDDEGRPIEILASSSEYQRDRDLQKGRLIS